MKIVIMSTLEYVSVFLLAVEAIKLDNLAWIKASSLQLKGFLNPEIAFVEEDEYIPPTTFFDKHTFKLLLAVNYTIGLAVFAWGASIIGISPNELIPGTTPMWAAGIFGAMFAVPLAGFVMYTAVVQLLHMVVVMLTWIESSTKSGVVGILGFVLFSIQFFMR